MKKKAYLDLDSWQKTVLGTKGNIVLRSGRQVGKSTVIAIKAAEYAIKNKGKTILVIASVERQAYLLFEKILAYMVDNANKLIRKGRHRPTKSKLSLTNGSIIYCLPTGLSGHGIRGYTIDLLIADEAAFIPEEVWAAVTPMLAVTKGDIILLSTPFGKGGYFFRCFSDPNFTSFHISSEDCPRISPDFLEEERKRMSKLEYAQEYLGEFVDELRQFFPTHLIESSLCLGDTEPIPQGVNYLGIDVAGMGSDDTVLYSVTEKGGVLYEKDLEIFEKCRTTETTEKVLFSNSRHNFKRIYIDDGGMGVGVFDQLLDNSHTKRKVEAINNSSRSLDIEHKRKKKLLKEDLYNNLLTLMEQGNIKLRKHDEVYQSLKSIQAEYGDGKLRISGKYSHITEALIRACWCVKSKSLNIWIDYS